MFCLIQFDWLLQLVPHIELKNVLCAEIVPLRLWTDHRSQEDHDQPTEQQDDDVFFEPYSGERPYQEFLCAHNLRC
jgi:hypothetical protein